nr:hypothetical protein [Tanacetum cinerariifolium]
MFTLVSAARSSYVNLGGSIHVNAATLPNADLFTNRKHAIGTKWVYRNEKDERGIVVRNKARLVAQCYTQEEGIDYDEVFAPIARIEAIRLFLAYASLMGFIVYQMDVKSAFLYGTIEEDVYVCQTPYFEDLHFPDKVYKVEKALCGLHQAPTAWYETLSTYLLENRFRRGFIDKTLFIKKDKGDILINAQKVPDEFYGGDHFFLGLQVMHRDEGIFISQDKYVANILKKFDFFSVKTASTPIETNKALHKDEEAKDRIFRYLKGQPKLGLWYLKDSPFDMEAFSDSDYAGASLDRKSTTKEKPTESKGFEQIIDFLNAIYFKYALTVNPTVYTSCIEQFWATAKVKIVNGEAKIQAIVEKKKVIID